MSQSTSQPGFFISHVIGESWQLFKQQWLKYWGVLLIPALMGVIFMMVTSSIPEDAAPVVALVYTLLQLIVGMGVIKVSINVARGKDVVFEDVFEPARYFLNYVLGIILYALIVIVGLLLLIVPGLIWGIKYMYIPFLIIDKGMSPLEAMRMSAKMTDGVKWDLMGYFFAILMFTYLGLFAFIIGVVVTASVAGISNAMVYDLLLKRAEGKAK